MKTRNSVDGYHIIVNQGVHEDLNLTKEKVQTKISELSAVRTQKLSELIPKDRELLGLHHNLVPRLNAQVKQLLHNVYHFIHGNHFKLSTQPAYSPTLLIAVPHDLAEDIKGLSEEEFIHTYFLAKCRERQSNTFCLEIPVLSRILISYLWVVDRVALFETWGQFRKKFHTISKENFKNYPKTLHKRKNCRSDFIERFKEVYCKKDKNTGPKRRKKQK